MANFLAEEGGQLGKQSIVRQILWGAVAGVEVGIVSFKTPEEASLAETLEAAAASVRESAIVGAIGTGVVMGGLGSALKSPGSQLKAVALLGALPWPYLCCECVCS